MTEAERELTARQERLEAYQERIFAKCRDEDRGPTNGEYDDLEYYFQELQKIDRALGSLNIAAD